MAEHLHIDFETRSACDLKIAGADVYSKHPTTDVWCMGFAFTNEPVFLWKNTDGKPRDVLDYVEAGGKCVAHNAPFELAIWNNVLVPKYCWPELKPEQIVCTMSMAYAMALPGSLEKAAAAAGIEKQKDMGGHRIMLQLSQPRKLAEDGTPIWWDDEEKLQKLFRYCIQDIEVERELFKRLMPLSPQERQVWLLDYEINQRGVAVDIEAVKAAIKMVEAEKDRLNSEMRKITNNAVATCTATGQLTDWLKWRGVELEGVAKADVIELLELDTLPNDCRAALLLRQEAAKSSTAKLESMLGSTGEDGRIRGIFQYHGAGTGRWAGRRIQPQNFPRPRLSEREIENVFELLRSVT